MEFTIMDQEAFIATEVHSIKVLTQEMKTEIYSMRTTLREIRDILHEIKGIIELGLQENRQS